IMIALTPWAVALATISICVATLFPGVGPRNRSGLGFCSSLAACSAPWWACSKNLLNLSVPKNLGTNTMLSALPGLAVARAKVPVGSIRIASAAIVSRTFFMLPSLSVAGQLRPAGKVTSARTRATAQCRPGGVSLGYESLLAVAEEELGGISLDLDRNAVQ